VAKVSKKGIRLGWSEGMLKINFLKQFFTNKKQKYAPLKGKNLGKIAVEFLKSPFPTTSVSWPKYLRKY
jgi:hypothetical protein